ncbi:flagellin [Lysobacter sp. H21R4]|uniref:flagellin n=1 Tax=Lysobacter sp. H21R4 TaxID=2781021 RepID=UPI00188822C6|nr:flagellin [Lysobacter sp. H21R4]QOY63344.1 flagellin [Lysobacter sp. H21R4]
MSVINTNVMSLNAQRNLNTNSADLGTTIQRLSSGLRINSAKDDAAGLAISERFTTQIRGMDQAARNANDGISLAQTAEGALGEIGNNLQRIRELAVQSRNATNSDSDRKALDAEVTQLKAEIQRVAEHTDFNGKALLDGTFGDAVFQIGANQGQTITVSGMADANTATLGTWHSPEAVVGVAPTAGALAAGDLTINGVDIGAVTAGSDVPAQGAAVALAINAKTAETGVKATADAVTGVITLEGGKEGVVIGGATANEAATKTATGLTVGTTTEKTGFATETVLTTEGADKMIRAMDAALESVNASRADLGAIQNRFSSVVTNLQTNSENLSASRSRIVDADYAKETANLSRSQILAQAGTAMLAQANQVPQNVLSLLR